VDEKQIYYSLAFSPDDKFVSAGAELHGGLRMVKLISSVRLYHVSMGNLVGSLFVEESSKLHRRHTSIFHFHQQVADTGYVETTFVQTNRHPHPRLCLGSWYP